MGFRLPAHLGRDLLRREVAAQKKTDQRQSIKDSKESHTLLDEVIVKAFGGMVDESKLSPEPRAEAPPRPRQAERPRQPVAKAPCSGAPPWDVARDNLYSEGIADRVRCWRQYNGDATTGVLSVQTDTHNFLEH